MEQGNGLCRGLSESSRKWLLNTADSAQLDMQEGEMESAVMLHVLPVVEPKGPYYGSLRQGKPCLFVQQPCDSPDSVRAVVFCTNGDRTDSFRCVFNVDFRNEVFVHLAYSPESELFRTITLGRNNGEAGGGEREEPPPVDILSVGWDCQFCRARGELRCICAPELKRREEEKAKAYRFAFTVEIVNTAHNRWSAFWHNFSLLMTQNRDFCTPFLALGANVTVHRSGRFLSDFRQFVLTSLQTECGMRVAKTHTDLAITDGGSEHASACPRCPSSFRRQYDLIRHLRSVHQQCKFFNCQHCDRSFSQRGHLNEHVQAVHMESNAVCEICDMRFSARSKLIRHTKSVHLQFKSHSCSRCGKMFAENSNLQRHEKRVHGVAKQAAVSLVTGETDRSSIEF
mmetsp:Transcript_12489/g.38104  ORF Transcript_12489/g.38104 Transcript_12489/m.38104 type:complete len:398 (-) Transcript_12489:2353-3546(-)